MRLTTRLSSKGQVVIPARVRRALGWKPGERLTVQVAPGGARAVTLSGRTATDLAPALARGYDWLEGKRVDLVGELHASRRGARVRERRRR